ncbi:hypothetical protein V1477_014602 [Vespula maculifrons]|uniref:Uncharacterized protein n=1 Tax=Vespula maculifrons TaxID=7453 RepID=A0ABD2BHX5_VESMC
MKLVNDLISIEVISRLKNCSFYGGMRFWEPQGTTRKSQNDFSSADGIRRLKYIQERIHEHGPDPENVAINKF